MTKRFPEVQTILGDAADLDTILPEGCGEVDAIVSGVPLKNLPIGKEEEINLKTLEGLRKKISELQKKELKKNHTTYKTTRIKTIQHFSRCRKLCLQLLDVGC